MACVAIIFAIASEYSSGPHVLTLTQFYAPLIRFRDIVMEMRFVKHTLYSVYLVDLWQRNRKYTQKICPADSFDDFYRASFFGPTDFTWVLSSCQNTKFTLYTNRWTVPIWNGECCNLLIICSDYTPVSMTFCCVYLILRSNILNGRSFCFYDKRILAAAFYQMIRNLCWAMF